MIHRAWPILTCFLFVANAALAKSTSPTLAPQSRAQFCEARKSQDYFQRLAKNPENHLAFENYGGLFNGGVCWWHSLFQRASLYLLVFKPELPKPNRTEAEKLIHSIAAGKHMVEIPGYTNIHDFSKDWEAQIQNKLEQWQKVDGFLKFAWIHGLSGTSQLAPLRLQKKIEALIDLANSKHQIQWTMLQMPGITSHAALVLGGLSAEPEFSLSVIDSNFPVDVYDFVYHQGDRALHTVYDRFVPYLGRQTDLQRFKRAGDVYCSGTKPTLDMLKEDLNNDLE